MLTPPSHSGHGDRKLRGRDWVHHSELYQDWNDTISERYLHKTCHLIRWSQTSGRRGGGGVQQEHACVVVLYP